MYKRQPGFWAPTDATWGVENRTAALRVIPGSDKSQRQEYRLGAADGNPFLALSVAIGSGLYLSLIHICTGRCRRAGP